MSSIKVDNVLYPIFPDVNDEPIVPSSERGGNGADFIDRYNNLVSAIAPRIKLNFNNSLSANLKQFYFLVLPVPFGIYSSSPASISWEALEVDDFASGVFEPLEFGGLNFLFTVAFTAGTAYGGGDPLDGVYWEVTGIDGMASFVDLPTLTVSAGYSSMTWNNLVGVLPLESNLKIEIAPSTFKPDVNQLITGPSFS